ncbi:glycosyltransferase [Haloferax namakaokahaiae]|uniref:Glycosyltransferase n=1 Tax=Haloferax namakaokahaiae TaxID=1748331 RepID=A0ABD5ZDU5_9EURY
MLRTIEIDPEGTSAAYAADPVFRQAVAEMQAETADDVASLKRRKIWMVNSTESGGGVAEMMETVVGLIREVGAEVTWAVMETDESQFFEYTKNIHNLLHGAGDPDKLQGDAEATYEAVSRRLAETIIEHIGPNDILCVHDPQPLAAGAYVVDELGIPAVWRCHIGSEEDTPESKATWAHLRPWIEQYDRTVFSLPEYVPEFLTDRTDIIPPAIDPISPKNRHMKPQEVAEVLARSALVDTDHPTTQFDQVARRLQRDGTFAPATEPEDIGLLFRPTFCEISRWDRLKGFHELLEGFARLKESIRPDANGQTTFDSDSATGHRGDAHRTRIADARLLLVGPDPATVSDDPEGQETLEDIKETWQALDDDLKEDVAVVVMPEDQVRSALVINALQRSATVVVQNSLREGFGLTVTEAMWKRAVLAGSDTGGIRAQITDGENGVLIPDASDPDSVARTLDEVLGSKEQWDEWSLNAHRNVTDEYLVFRQVTRWIATARNAVES